ncbi:hypothetical protein BaRGS_00012177 [Batillaria attramentaria]|uniref:Protein inturned n=1 Tax=Batillaria attramentaria TaxID=370345 RepID=A0ABD0LBA1_9CAEN
MAYFPSFKPFYDPDKEQEVYREQDGSLRVRSRPLTPPGVSVFGGCRPDPGNGVDGIHKIESSWSRHVHPEQGDLFYIEVDGKTRARSNSLPRDQLHTPPRPARHDNVDTLSRQDGMRHSDSAVPPPRLSRCSGSEEDEEEKMRSRTELRKKSEQLQQALRKKQNQPKNGAVRLAGKFQKTPKSHRTALEPALIQQNNSKVLLAHNSTNSYETSNGVTTKQNGAMQQQIQQQNGRQLKDVTLLPDFSKRTDLSGSNCKVNGAELVELLLGVVLCRYNQRPPSGAGVNGDSGGGVRHEKKGGKLVVQGIVSGSAADKSGKIHRGDMLVYLNGQEVTWSNLASLIQSVKAEVKLTFQVPKIIGPTSCSTSATVSSSRLPAYHNLCMLVTGRDIFYVQQQLLQHTCVAMYLTLVSSSDETSSRDDIIYSFPAQEETLTTLRGLFLTLSSSLHDVVQSGAKSSTLEISGRLVNIVYHKHGPDVLLMAALNDRLPLPVLQSAMEDVRRMLCTVFGAVDRAFRDGESGQLDQVFALLFHRLLCKSGSDMQGSQSSEKSSTVNAAALTALEVMPSSQLIQLSEENRLICDEILSEFEAVDFDDYLEDSELYSRRSYSVLGCSLFYKNYLVCSHLLESDHRDIYSFLKCHSLLALAARQPIDELVVWQEVHLTRRSSESAAETNIGYQEPTARWFMLIVGMKHFLLATLVEAGGCSQEAVGRPGPHPLFVDQARATLVQLDTDEVHMSACCQERLSEDCETSMVVSAERYFTRSKPGREDMGAAVKSPTSAKPPSPGRASSENGFRYRSSPRTDRRPGEGDVNDRNQAGSVGDAGLMRRQGSKLSYGSNDSGGSGSSAGAPKSKSSRFSSLLDMSSIGRSMSALHIDTVGSPVSQGKLTRGHDNVLFHFIHHNDLEGVLVMPADLDPPPASDSVHAEVLANFHRCVLNIRSLFYARDAHQAKADGQHLFQCESSVTQCVEEHGVLFQCPVTPVASNDRRQQQFSGYWVVGRRFSSDGVKQELYVCFHESASQCLVEMAFALGFGT